MVAVALTVLGTYYVLRTGRMRDELHFRATAEEMRHLIEIRIHTYIELLRAGVALFSASDDVTAEEFRDFVFHLRLPGRYPGIQGIGFAAGGGSSPALERAAIRQFTARSLNQ